MAKAKNPHFFCESCGAEVPGSANTCPRCHRYFASVLCPACGFSGEEGLFRNGCPVCGHSSGPERESVKTAGMRRRSPNRPKFPAGALPLWVYILTAAAFTGVLALFFTLL